MTERIIEVGSDDRYLSVYRGFMLISEGEDELARIPLDDIGAVIASARGLSYSNNLIVELAKRNAPVVICGSNHAPAALLLSLEGHHRQSGRIDTQIKASESLKKNVWKQIIQSKIRNQGSVLSALERPANPFFRMADKVKSGDPDNYEAQAARRYFPMVFGRDFRRDRSEATLNAMLNYGYMIIRSTVARYVVATGFHPGIPIYHRNTLNSMRLVDDLMEPYRPYVDLLVIGLYEDGFDCVSTETKPKLAEVLEMAVAMPKATVSLRRAIELTVQSLVRVYEKEEKKICLPLPDIQIWKG